jgi:hypothetical protein
MEDFYGNGRNQQISFARELSKNWVLRLRYRAGDAGKRFEIRMDYKFNL